METWISLVATDTAPSRGHWQIDPSSCMIITCCSGSRFRSANFEQHQNDCAWSFGKSENVFRDFRGLDAEVLPSTTNTTFL